jgi:alkylated DNA repair dioxygenase AlkB
MASNCNKLSLRSYDYDNERVRIVSDTKKIPEGFVYIPEFITRSQENELLEKIVGLNWQEVKMHGIVAKRRVVHFGLDYTYTSRLVKPTIPPPIFLSKFIEKAAFLMGLCASEIVEILISEYPVGAGIGWHKDAAIFGDKVFGFSLGGACTLRFRAKKQIKYEVFKVELIPCSAYILSGPSRNDWQHSISPVKAKRYSITFRTLD